MPLIVDLPPVREPTVCERRFVDDIYHFLNRDGVPVEYPSLKVAPGNLPALTSLMGQEIPFEGLAIQVSPGAEWQMVLAGSVAREGCADLKQLPRRGPNRPLLANQVGLHSVRIVIHEFLHQYTPYEILASGEHEGIVEAVARDLTVRWTRKTYGIRTGVYRELRDVYETEVNHFRASSAMRTGQEWFQPRAVFYRRHVLMHGKEPEG
jgi:hypothetical protein